MLLDNLLPSFFGALGAPLCFVKKLTHPDLVSFGILASLKKMKSKKIIQDIDSIWDVGANKGQFAYMANATWPNIPIYSFEPDPIINMKLIENFNKYNIPGEVFLMALGDSDQNKVFIRDENDVNSSFLKKQSSPSSKEETIEVICSTLDIISLHLPEVQSAFLKLDVQGFELMVLKGANRFLKHCSYVQIEVSFSPVYLEGAHMDEILLFMRQYGFKCIEILDLLREKQGPNSILEADLLFQRCLD